MFTHDDDARAKDDTEESTSKTTNTTKYIHAKKNTKKHRTSLVGSLLQTPVNFNKKYILINKTLYL